MLPYQHAERERFDGAGIYCFYPFDSKLVNNKGVFKIGMTTSFDKRTYGFASRGLYRSDVHANETLKKPRLWYRRTREVLQTN